MDIITKFNKLVNEAINEGAFPGCNYAIVFKDKVITDSLGNRSLYPEVEKNSLDTIYDMASLTKIISTTTMMLKLIEDGRVRLYAEVKKYLKDFKLEGVTIWNLMTHTSGLPEGVSGLFELKNKEDVMKKIYSLDKVYEPSTKIKYSDIGYILLGEIIEKVTNKALNEVVKEEIFDKLEMNDTMYLPPFSEKIAPTELRQNTVHDRIERGKVHDETSYIMGGVAGHAGLFSTVSDVSKFLQMILNDGVYKNQKILSKQTIDMLYTPQVAEVKGVSQVLDARSLGWINKGSVSSAGELTSSDTILHTGFTGTNIWVDRKNGVAFVLLSNRVHPTRQNILHMDARARFANFIIAHLDEFERNNTK